MWAIAKRAANARCLAMTDLMDTRYFIAFFRLAAEALEAHRQDLCALDGEIGDGDHGSSMANGFAAISAGLRGAPALSLAPGALLRQAATAFLGESGGTVGPLYATALTEAAALLEKGPLDRRDLAAVLSAFATGIARRGGAGLGDKTMLDAWIPAHLAARTAASAGGDAAMVAAAAARAALAGAETTASMIASRGRASRLKERSLGHLDPGAVSAALIISAFADSRVPGA